MGSFSRPIRHVSPELAAPPPFGQALAARLVFNSDAARILTWNNVVVHSIFRPDAAWAHAFGGVLREQLRAYPEGVVSLAVLRPGFQLASKAVRAETARLTREAGRRVRHMLVVEDVGLVTQLLVTVIRGVVMLGGKHVQYSLPESRTAAVREALPMVHGSARATTLERELSAAVAFCCTRDG